MSSVGDYFLFQCRGCLQERQAFWGTVFLSGGPLDSGLKCVCGGPLSPWTEGPYVYWLLKFYLPTRFFKNELTARVVHSTRGVVSQPNLCLFIWLGLVSSNE